ncbi:MULTISPECIES: hypothetical protein [unclassified Coleofasciculus]|nr:MULTISPECIES: hypothetical protein [unclassified Coleofasciculus]
MSEKVFDGRSAKLSRAAESGGENPREPSKPLNFPTHESRQRD